jgi:hypothetical protein
MGIVLSVVHHLSDFPFHGFFPFITTIYI